MTRREIDSLKKYLQKQFQTKNIGFLKYFLGIEVVRSKKSIILSQKKYVLDLLWEARMLRCKSIDFLMDVNISYYQINGSFLRMSHSQSAW